MQKVCENCLKHGLLTENEDGGLDCLQCGFVYYRFDSRLLTPEEVMRELPEDIRSQPKRNKSGKAEVS